METRALGPQIQGQERDRTRDMGRPPSRVGRARREARLSRPDSCPVQQPRPSPRWPVVA
ncbi:hypothetical protein BN126310134 [Stenotrophomonas indicatrix]|nr:hypothetical protein BN126310134 [Stenotrophomonas indicatrix]